MINSAKRLTFISDQMFDAGRQAIPDNEVNVAADLYAALNDFYARNAPHFDDRPLIVAGESYAGLCFPCMHDKM